MILIPAARVEGSFITILSSSGKKLKLETVQPFTWAWGLIFIPEQEMVKFPRDNAGSTVAETQALESGAEVQSPKLCCLSGVISPSKASVFSSVKWANSSPHCPEAVLRPGGASTRVDFAGLSTQQALNKCELLLSHSWSPQISRDGGMQPHPSAWLGVQVPSLSCPRKSIPSMQHPWGPQDGSEPWETVRLEWSGRGGSQGPPPGSRETYQSQRCHPSRESRTHTPP